jgi:hypothetical protein
MPTRNDEDFEDGDYVEQMRYYCYLRRPTGARFRINAWKNLGQRIDLASSGGHKVAFEGYNVYPTKFILRHYIALGRDQLIRKYCQRTFSQQELDRGWHWTRATIRPEDITFPTRDELKEVAADNTWDTSEPWSEEPIFRNTFHPPLASQRNKR